MSSRTPSSPASSAARGRRRVDASLVVGTVLVGLVVVTALVSFVWTPHPPGLTDGSVALRGPMAGYPLGTDRLGQDELSRLMVGARTTLLVGIVAVGLAAVGSGTYLLTRRSGDSDPGPAGPSGSTPAPEDASTYTDGRDGGPFACPATAADDARAPPATRLLRFRPCRLCQS